jgi:hypothetical protein
MREKVEREAPSRASGAVRLTEYEGDRRNGFVDRMEKETTSFFFTNFPDEVQAMELWALFAKHGRVGEVYIPNKRDKWGNRFGFVIFKEVKSVESLSSRLDDVWVGSYKIRVNLSRFGRKRSAPPADQSKFSTPKKVIEDVAQFSGPFKQALLKSGGEQDKSMVASVEVEVIPDMLQSLEGSWVGRLMEGVEVRALQTKLWLAGFHTIRVIVMGRDIVLISSSSGEELRGPLCKKGWWGGLLFDIKRWTPNLVYDKRVIWVKMLGIPLHAWGENTFRLLANRCGTFLSLDAGTRNKYRLDVARVKLEVPLGGRVDQSVKIIVHGASYWVRVMEEGGRSVEEEEFEDQLNLCDAVSSCASGGQAAAMVVVDVMGDEDTDSEASEGCQRYIDTRAQEVNLSTGGKRRVEKGEVMSGECSGNTRFIPSINPPMKGIEEKRRVNPSEVFQSPTSLGGVLRSGQGKGDHSTAVLASGELGLKEGHVELGEVPTGIVDLSQVESSVGVDPDPGLAQTTISDPLPTSVLPSYIQQGGADQNLPGPILVALEHKQVQARANLEGGGFCSESLDDVSNGSFSNSQHLFEEDSSQPGKVKIIKQRKPSVPLSTLLGPKCVRFADVVNNNICLVQRRRNVLTNGSSSSDHHSLSAEFPEGGESRADGGRSRVGRSSLEDDSISTAEEVEESQKSPGINLEVVLPFNSGANTQSGVNLLLSEDSLQDVEGYKAARENPEAINLEAQKLFCEQQKIGFSFDQNEVAPIGRMVDMEDRDRVDFSKRQGSSRPQ